MKALRALSGMLSTVDRYVFALVLLLTCAAVALAGMWKTPSKGERLIHPLLKIGADLCASALGYFLVRLAFSVLPSSKIDSTDALGSSAFFLVASLVLWTGQSIALRHASKEVWGTRRNPVNTEFPKLFRRIGIGGFVVAAAIFTLGQFSV